jgi:hypothetical protein
MATSPNRSGARAQPRKQSGARKQSRKRGPAAARLNEGRDFTRDGHAIVVSANGFERMAGAILSGRPVYARVGANIVLKVLAK